MTKEETLQLLKVLSSGFKIEADEDAVRFWQIGLEGLDKEDIWQAIKIIIQEDENQYNNLNPAKIRNIIRILKKHRGETADYEADWMKFKTPIGREALERLGGYAWFGGLPDPLYSDNPGAATNTLNRARDLFLTTCGDIENKCENLMKRYPKLLTKSDEALAVTRKMRLTGQTAEQLLTIGNLIQMNKQNMIENKKKKAS